MRIAQVAPLFESIPPKRYGGTERVISYLTEELVRLGHEVTLFASGDSETNEKLLPTCPTTSGSRSAAGSCMPVFCGSRLDIAWTGASLVGRTYPFWGRYPASTLMLSKQTVRMLMPAECG